MNLRLLLFFLLAATSALAGPPAFKEAADLYGAQDYEGARAKYEQLLADGVISANVFYDLGNTEHRLKRPGYAALAYERALLLEPRHHEAAVNLALLRAQAGAKKLPASQVDPVLLPIPAPVYITVGAIAFWGAVLSAAALLLWQSTPRILVLPCVACVLVAGYSGVALWRVAREQATAVVLVPEAIARLDAADRAGVAEVLPAGSDVRVLSEHGDWIYCELPGGGRGWLPRKSIEKVAHSA
jgi:tetratricopeptide (TPR) repeat protein